jgi:hypothetical protein
VERRAAAAVCVLAFATVYVTTWSSVRPMRIAGVAASARRRLAVLAVCGLLTLATIALIGASGLSMTPFLIVLAWCCYRNGRPCPWWRP